MTRDDLSSGAWGACSQALAFLMAGRTGPRILANEKEESRTGGRSTGLSFLFLKPLSSGQPIHEER